MDGAVAAEHLHVRAEGRPETPGRLARELHQRGSGSVPRADSARAAARGIRFVYALSPGLDINYDDPAELHVLQRRVDQMMTLGCRDFALLFDDIPDTLDAAVIARFGSLAAAQCDVTNALARWIVEKEPRARIAFCPTPYCSRMVKAGLGGDGYLPTVGRELMPSIDVFWTGPDIVSREITAEHVRRDRVDPAAEADHLGQPVRQRLRRPPLLLRSLCRPAARARGPRRTACCSTRTTNCRSTTSRCTRSPRSCTTMKTVKRHGSYEPRAAYLAAHARVGRVVRHDQRPDPAG